MSLPKAQLVDPQGNMNLPGMNATGVITASSFSGTGGVVTNLTGSPDLDVGIVTGVTWDVRGRGIMQEAAVACSWRNGRRMSRSRVQLSRNTHGTKVNAVLVQLDII